MNKHRLICKFNKITLLFLNYNQKKFIIAFRLYGQDQKKHYQLFADSIYIFLHKNYIISYLICKLISEFFPLTRKNTSAAIEN